METERKNGEDRRAHMLNDRISKLIPKIAVPSICSMLVGALYNMADTFFVGQLGTSASGAVGIVLPIMNLLQALSFIFAHGVSSYVSRLLGGGDTRNASRAISTAICTSMILGVVYGVVGIIWLQPLLRVFGATETILPYAGDYAIYIYIASPMFAASYVMNNALRAEGSVLASFVGMVSGAVLNIILDPIFIFTFKMGTGGAGCATMIGQAVSFLVLLSFYVRKSTKKHSALTLSLRLFTPKWAMYKELVRVGFSSFVRMGLGSLSAIVLNTMAAPYGDAAIAAFSIVTRILMLSNNALIGYGQAYQPISGFNYGAGKFDRVREAYWFTFKSALVFVVGCAALLIAFAPGLIGMFRNDPDVIAIGARTLRWQSAALPLACFTMVSSMMFQSTGGAGSAFITALARQGLCFIPLALLLPRFFGLGGLIVAQAAADVLTLIITAPLVYKAIRALHKKEADKPLAAQPA